MQVPWQLIALTLAELGFDVPIDLEDNRSLVATRGSEMLFFSVGPDETLSIEWVIEDLRRTVEIGGLAEADFVAQFRQKLADILTDMNTSDD